jgi:bacillithiol system protein YtxJ
LIGKWVKSRIRIQAVFRFISHFMRQLATAAAPPEEQHMTTIDSEASLAACLEESHQGAVFLLKHSTRCPISTSALREVRAYLDEMDGAGPRAYINYVVEARPLSQRLAELLDVQHASPQLFLVSGEKACWNTSHSGITQRAMTSAYGEWQLKSE